MHTSAPPRQYPLHIHVSTLFLALIVAVGGLLLGIGYVTSRDLINVASQPLRPSALAGWQHHHQSRTTTPAAAGTPPNANAGQLG